MGIFLKEETFCQFLKLKYPKRQFYLGNSYISINIVNLKPIMSCIYLDDKSFVAVRYNQHFETFADTILMDRKNIQKIILEKRGINKVLILQTDQLLENNECMIFKMNLSNFTNVGWHKKNLKGLISTNSI